MGAGMAEPDIITAFPSSVLFPEFEQDVMYLMTVRIQNTTSRGQRVKIVEPLSAAFNVSYENKGVIAGGLCMDVDVEFMGLQMQDYTDTLTIVTEGQVIEVPLKALKPVPRFECRRTVDFDRVTLNEMATQQVRVFEGCLKGV